MPNSKDRLKKYAAAFRKALGVDAEFSEKTEQSAVRKKLFAIRITDPAAEEKLGAFRELFAWRCSLDAQDLKLSANESGLLKRTCCRQPVPSPQGQRLPRAPFRRWRDC